MVMARKSLNRSHPAITVWTGMVYFLAVQAPALGLARLQLALPSVTEAVAGLCRYFHPTS